MVDVRVDGPAIDRAAALLALHDPGAGESQIQNSHSRIIGEEKENVISLPFPSLPLEENGDPPAFQLSRVARDGFRASDKLTHHVRPLSPYSEGALYSRPLWSRRRSCLDTTLEHRSDAADRDYPPAPIRAQAHLWPHALGPHSLLGKGTVHRSEDDQHDVGDPRGEARLS